MSQVTNFAPFEFPKLSVISYAYEPLIEYMALLDDLYKCYETDIQKNTCRKFKEILNRYLGGRKPTEDQLKSIYSNRKYFGTADSDFLVYSKRLYQLAKSYIDIDVVVVDCLLNILSRTNGKVAILTKEADFKTTFETQIDDALLARIEYISVRELKQNYLNFPILIFAPGYWLHEDLTYSCSEITYLIQPMNLPNPKLENSIFDGEGGMSLWTSPKVLPKVDNYNLNFPSPKDYKRKELKKEFSLSLLTELENNKPSLFSMEVIDASGNVEYIETHRKYITIDNKGELALLAFDDDSELHKYSYIVSDIDYSELSDDEVNQELRIQMDLWKKPLNSYSKQYELSDRLTALGAKNAKLINIKNWMKKDTIRPKSDDDFIALLRFAEIPEADFSTFFSLARNIRSNCISIGHKKSEISRELVAKELRKYIIQKDELPSRMSVGAIKISILALA